jgi:hypothetical protein
MSASFLVIRKRPRADLSVPMAARSIASRWPELMSFPLLFGQRVAFIAAAMRVEKLAAALCRIINGILLARNEVIERRIEQYLRPFVGCDCAHQIGAIGRAPEDLLKGLLVLVDRRDLGHGGIHAGLAHFMRIDDCNAACSSRVLTRPSQNWVLL